MSIEFNLIVDSTNAENDVYELKEFIDELHINSLTANIKETQSSNGEVTHMGAEILPILEVAVALASSAGGVAFVKGLFDCIKAYILSNAQNKQVILQKGTAKIVFNSNSVGNLQELIDKFTDMLKIK